MATSFTWPNADPSCADLLLDETALDTEEEDDEPCEVRELRRRMAVDRARLIAEMSHPHTHGYLSFQDLYWILRFSWACLQDYVEEANATTIRIAQGFPDVAYYFEEGPDGASVPCRPRTFFRRAMEHYAVSFDADETPAAARDEDDYRVATCV